MNQPKFIISNLPMPPSSNSQYWAVKVGGFAKIAPSESLKAYHKEFEAWSDQNKVLLAKAGKFMRDEMLKDQMLKIDTYACFGFGRLWTKDFRPQKMDGSNRIKALHDCFANAVGIDDCFIWNGSFEKVETRKEKPFCIMVIRGFKPRGLGDLNKDNL